MVKMSNTPIATIHVNASNTVHAANMIGNPSGSLANTNTMVSTAAMIPTSIRSNTLNGPKFNGSAI